MQRRATAIYLVAVLAGVGLLFATRIDFSGPITGSGDVGMWKYMGFYIQENIHFAPWPVLSLVNDQAFYPYGTNHVFQPWAFERDGFAGLLSAVMAKGPWLQVYYVISILITAIGSYALLRKDHGALRAGAVGWLVTFLNAYAIHKYPAHLGYSILHWSTLGIIADFVIVRHVVRREPVSLQLVLIRLGLTSLSLGLDLGYVAGTSLTSLTLSVIFCLGILLVRHRGARAMVRAAKAWAGAARAEARAKPVATATLALVWLTASFLYVPLALQIAQAAKSYDFSSVDDGFWYASRWRLIVPYFPFLHPDNNPFDHLIKDDPEGFAAGTAGWTLLLPGLLGAWYGRKRLLCYVPLLAFFALCWLQMPELRTLKIFPWSAFNRVATRMTFVYPAVFGLLALNVPFEPSKWAHRVGMALLVALAGTETFTVYSKPPEPTYAYDDEFYGYMKRVRAQPGEAILDWPFCVTGGNGVGGGEGLCPYYDFDRSNFALRLFHHKKVVGQYFGRLHPTQIGPFLKAGWDKMLAPKEQGILVVHCFDEAEWRRFDDFFVAHDFAGIQLHTKFLEPECVKQFHARFGAPSASVIMPETGEIQFIPKRERHAALRH